jgi:eukaryotic-like serine/threonine-protein kinase
MFPRLPNELVKPAEPLAADSNDERFTTRETDSNTPQSRSRGITVKTMEVESRRERVFAGQNSHQSVQVMPPAISSGNGHEGERSRSRTAGNVVALKSPNTAPLLETGFVLNGKWEIVEHIATGGKGEVYRARQINLERDVVVKTISAEYLAELGNDDDEIRTETERFRREALAMARVRHRHVVQVYDQGSDVFVKNGSTVTVCYLVMEYIPGVTLRSTMPEQGFGADERTIRDWIRRYFIPILDGLETVHELEMVHRDIKPENVLLDGSTPKITDFGIAGSVRWQGLTKTHHVEGTISYMAPEQFMDLPESDVRGDVYALGKMLYEAVSGRMKDSRSACLLKSACLESPETSFLRELDRIVRQATHEDKDSRIPSVDALRQSLAELLSEACDRKQSSNILSWFALSRIQRDIVIGSAAVLVGFIVCFF